MSSFPGPTAKKLGATEHLECWQAIANSGQTFLVNHSRTVLDPRAGLAIELMKAWTSVNMNINGMAEVIGENRNPHEGERRRATMEQLAMLATDTAQTVYDELERRGWLIHVPPYDALMRDPEIERER